MSKVPNEKLIELARLAPKVEWQESKTTKVEVDVSNLFDFLALLDVKAGRNEVNVKDFYKLYSQWDIDGTSYKDFRKDLKKYVKFNKAGNCCRLNKMYITIEEAYKELSSGKDEE